MILELMFFSGIFEMLDERQNNGWRLKILKCKRKYNESNSKTVMLVPHVPGVSETPEDEAVSVSADYSAI